jgi:hypothetical protein
MNPLNQRLQETFLFSTNDLRANHSGRLSERQQARLRAAGASQRLSLGIFVVVMVGTLGVIAIGSLSSGSAASLGSPEMAATLLIASFAIGIVIVIGVLSSRKYVLATRPRKILVVEGSAQAGKIQPDEAHFEIKIGAVKIRLLTEEQLAAFQIGVAYRVFYAPGPTPTILSGEVVGSEVEARPDSEPETTLAQDVILQRHRRARPVLVVLAALALGIPLVAIATANLSGILRWGSIALLLGVSIWFVFWAIARLAGGEEKRRIE